MRGGIGEVRIPDLLLLLPCAVGDRPDVGYGNVLVRVVENFVYPVRLGFWSYLLKVLFLLVHSHGE